MFQKRYEQSRYTADMILTREDDHILLIERGWDPFKGQWALPGGHVDPGETSRVAAVRELAEETGVHVSPASLRQVGVFDRPDRDPRGRYVTVPYRASVPVGTLTAAGDDAAAVRWWPLGGLPELAFDHDQIIAEAALATTAWPEGVIARYETVVGAYVEITGSGDYTSYHCTGSCGVGSTVVAEWFSHEKAQAHAEKCRALPRPTTEGVGA